MSAGTVVPVPFMGPRRNSSGTPDEAAALPYMPGAFPPHRFGWVRCPARDDANWQAWERPDGTIYLHRKAMGRLMLYRRAP